MLSFASAENLYGAIKAIHTNVAFSHVWNLPMLPADHFVISDTAESMHSAIEHLRRGKRKDQDRVHPWLSVRARSLEFRWAVSVKSPLASQ